MTHFIKELVGLRTTNVMTRQDDLHGCRLLYLARHPFNFLGSSPCRVQLYFPISLSLYLPCHQRMDIQRLSFHPAVGLPVILSCLRKLHALEQIRFLQGKEDLTLSFMHPFFPTDRIFLYVKANPRKQKEN